MAFPFNIFLMAVWRPCPLLRLCVHMVSVEVMSSIKYSIVNKILNSACIPSLRVLFERIPPFCEAFRLALTTGNYRDNSHLILY
jgi:hypothetical protein